MHGPPLLLLQSARKPPDEGGRHLWHPQGPAHLFQCTEQDQREDILNMMISTEDRVSYLLKCGFNEVDMKCAQVIERSVSLLTNGRRSLLELQSESTLRTHILLNLKFISFGQSDLMIVTMSYKKVKNIFITIYYRA